MPYCVDKTTGLIDYDTLATTAKLFRPKMIVAGTSAYSRQLDYARFRQIADSVGAILMADMAHISGLVATGLHPSPFEYADVVTTTTHKTLRAARGAMIFFRKRKPAPVPKSKAAHTATTVVNGCGDTFVATDYEQRINEAVFPGLQGGPHNNNIAAIAVGLHEAAQPAFADYQRQVLANSRRLAAKLQEYGYQIVTGGTDTHLLLVDFRPIKLDGVRVCSVLDLLGVTVNKNTVPGDISAMRPSGVRLGTPALTSRGLKLEDMDRVAGFIHRGIQLAQEISRRAASNNIKDFEAILASDEEVKNSMKTLRAEIIEFASSFPLPGMEDC
ncbi:Serine hydroxymethyltransferase, cytosolic [Sparganum proliferum]